MQKLELMEKIVTAPLNTEEVGAGGFLMKAPGRGGVWPPGGKGTGRVEPLLPGARERVAGSGK